MRKNVLPFLALLITASVLTSCQKQLLIDQKDSIANQPQEKQYAYVSDNLKATMKALAPLMKDKEFVALIHSEVAKKFDGSSNVLIKTLVENPRFAHTASAAKVNEALKAFTHIEGENFYPPDLYSQCRKTRGYQKG